MSLPPRDTYARLAPAIYSGSPAIAITVPLQPSDADQAAAEAIREALTGLGCELLQIDASNSAHLQHARPDSHQSVHVVYNKSYDDAEMSASLGEFASDFQRGHDLNSFLALGERVWQHFDRAVSLDFNLHPNLPFFVDMAQLEQSVLDRYTEYEQLHRALAASAAPS
jgi:hypothetical protein